MTERFIYLFFFIAFIMNSSSTNRVVYRPHRAHDGAVMRLTQIMNLGNEPKTLVLACQDAQPSSHAGSPGEVLFHLLKTSIKMLTIRSLPIKMKWPYLNVT